MEATITIGDKFVKTDIDGTFKVSLPNKDGCTAIVSKDGYKTYVSETFNIKDAKIIHLIQLY